MGLTNLLTSSQLIEVAVDGIGTVDLNWIGYVISWIFNLVSDFPGAIAVGVIIFTLMLKTIVLPLDIYSRVKMKKQSLLMESMRPEMEKLQKQYANDKNMYSQKVMELQKAHGYNPLGACLPSIISLVIFMVVFSAFSQYSQFANLTAYNEMAKSYSNAVYEYVQAEDEQGDKYFLIAAVEDGLNNPKPVQPKKDESGRPVDDEGNELNIYGYYVDYDKFAAFYPAYVAASEEEDLPALPQEWATLDENQKNAFVSDFVRLGARVAAADYYISRRPQTSLLWIGNLWYPDSMLNKEVPTFANFRSTIQRAAGSIDADYEQSYNEVTFNLTKQKNTYNGYFVLIVLAIGFMFLQQFITMRSQKAANELSSVDGQAATTNKMMMIMMPIIFGIFSFFYSAAFSIYMIVNTVYSLISTLIINKIVSVRFEKDSDKKERERLQGRAGRKRLK